LSDAAQTQTNNNTNNTNNTNNNYDDDEDEEFHRDDDMMAGYSPDLVDELERFSYNEPGVEHPEGTASGGPFLDMGNVAPGSVCTITIRTINLLSEDVRIDVLARNFNATNDTSVKTKTKAIVPGMSRNHVVFFTTTDTVGAQVGLVTFIGASERGGCRCEIVCPVFYRVDPAVRPRSLLSMRTLPDAKSRFLGLWAREELRVSFERARGGQMGDFFFGDAGAAAGAGGVGRSAGSAGLQRPRTGGAIIKGQSQQAQQGQQGKKETEKRRAATDGGGGIGVRMPSLGFKPGAPSSPIRLASAIRPTTAAM
jgi:hypothetical protein